MAEPVSTLANNCCYNYCDSNFWPI